MVIINIFSKYGDAETMFRKESEAVLAAMKIIFSNMGYPMSIYSDDDGAFKLQVK